MATPPSMSSSRDNSQILLYSVAILDGYSGKCPMTEFDRSFDVICVGSGVSGCASALAAAAQGLDVCLLEKAALLGGGSAYSLGALWVGGNHLMAEAGISDSLDDARTYLEFLAGGAAIKQNLDTYIDKSPGVLSACERLGLAFRMIKGLPDHYYPTAPGSKGEGRSLEAAPIRKSSLGRWAESLQQGPYAPPGMAWSDAVAWGGFGNRRGWDAEALSQRARDGVLGAGQGLVAQFLAALIARNVPILTEFATSRLVLSDGRVTGLEGTHRSERVALEARCGIVLATGGYEGSEDLVRRFEGIADWRTMFPPTIDGDGLVMATEIGAAVYRVPVSLCLLLGYLVPDPSGDGEPTFRNAGPREFTFPHCIIVNRAGQRFADESQFQHVVPALRRFEAAGHTYPNLPCFLILDRQYLDRYSFADLDPGSSTPEWMCPSQTIEELATRLGIDPVGLKQSVDIFNSAAARGEDPEFGRGSSIWSKSSGGDQTHKVNPNLGPLEKPPYCGVRLYPTGTSSAGLLTDEHGSVIHVRGHPIPGLYACGNTAAPTDFGVGYQAGLTLMSGILFGFLAAEHAHAARG